jgi:glycosyltransferase involved in cell wall biosynthesis
MPATDTASPATGMRRPSITLNMIVKDEAHVIARCLASVRLLIDHWVIVDTGSSDGTQQLIRDLLHDIPGTLHERPWKNFGHNRNEALGLAAQSADYIVFIDADDVLEFDTGFDRSALHADAYEFDIHYGELIYRRVCMVATRLPWRWEGVVHEYLACDESFGRAVLPDVRMRIVGGGGRSQVTEQEKFSRDAALLEAALQHEPDNTRYQFYLAQSYRDSSQLERALLAYERRATMGGFAEEVFCSLLQSARMARRLGREPAEIIDRFLRAHESRPTRAEALGSLAMYLRESGPRWELAHLFAQRAATIPRPHDALFVEREWYEWRCLDEYSIAAYWVGDYATSKTACERLLSEGLLPEAHTSRVRQNLDFALRALTVPLQPG